MSFEKVTLSRRRPGLSHFLPAVLLALPTPSTAGEVESFQTGPIGHGYGYMAINGLQSEFRFSTINYSGKETYSSLPNEKTEAQTLQTKLQTATAYRASQQFYMVGFADIEINSHEQESRIDNEKLESGANSYNFGARAIFEVEKFTLGGQIAINMIGEEERILKTSQGRFTSTAGWTALPEFEILGGYREGIFNNFLRVKFFSQGEYEVETSNDGAKIIYDNMRKSPATFSFSTLADVHEMLQVGGQVKFTAAAQASQPVDEWSREFAENGRRITSKNKQDTNQLALSVGGKFFPIPVLSLALGATIETAKYANENKSSFEDNNFGGTSFLFTGEFIPDPNIRLHASSYYMIPKTISYKKSASDDTVVRHQSITTGDGSTAKATASAFGMSFGGTYMF